MRGVEISSAQESTTLSQRHLCNDNIWVNIYFVSWSYLPIRLFYPTSWSTMKEDDGNASREATFFIVDRMNGGHLKVPWAVYRWSVWCCHFQCCVTELVVPKSLKARFKEGQFDNSQEDEAQRLQRNRTRIFQGLNPARQLHPSNLSLFSSQCNKASYSVYRMDKEIAWRLCRFMAGSTFHRCSYSTKF